MAGMAAQQAPRQAGKQTPQRAAKQESKAGMKEKLHALPQAAGIALMIVLLALSLPIGNYRALQNATPKDFLRQGDVDSIIEDRIDAAQNVLTIARRAKLDGREIQAAENAAEALEEAKTARKISRADQTLTAAVSELTTDSMLTGEDSVYMQRAADDFAEQGSFLRQEARAYNQQAEKAAELYEKLPTKFLFAEPDMYEGV